MTTINIKKEANERFFGIGSRESGKRIVQHVIRPVLIDTHKTQERITLDFTGIGVCASGFLHEIVGVLFNQMGFTRFTRRIKIVTDNPEMELLIDIAIRESLPRIQRELERAKEKHKAV